ncbi:MAG: hypothetical protein IIX78_06100, partial [Alistipes sp.]|nr:hypothetical protein [Alistipes sp.]
MVRKVVLLCWLLLGCISASGQLRMAYYDVDRLCDTLPSLFYYDPYTPDGPNRWNTARYRHKVEQVAAVIDSMGLEIVALYGVENEAVVRDIVRSSRQDYSYYHTTLNASDGMDFALLYYGDKLEVVETEAGPRSLRIEARIRRDTVTLLLVADRRRCANEVAVGAFLEDRIGFLDIADHVERTMAKWQNHPNPTLEELIEIDA